MSQCCVGDRWFAVEIVAGLYTLEVTGETTSGKNALISYKFDLFERFGEYSQFTKLGRQASYVSKKGPIVSNAYEISARHNSVVWIRASDAKDTIDVDFKLRRF